MKLFSSVLIASAVALTNQQLDDAVIDVPETCLDKQGLLEVNQEWVPSILASVNPKMASAHEWSDCSNSTKAGVYKVNPPTCHGGNRADYKLTNIRGLEALQVASLTVSSACQTLETQTTREMLMTATGSSNELNVTADISGVIWSFCGEMHWNSKLSGTVQATLKIDMATFQASIMGGYVKYAGFITELENFGPLDNFSLDFKAVTTDVGGLKNSHFWDYEDNVKDGIKSSFKQQMTEIVAEKLANLRQMVPLVLQDHFSQHQ